MKEDRKEVSMVTHLQFGDAGGQHHGEQGDEEVAVLPQRQVRLAAQLLEPGDGERPRTNQVILLTPIFSKLK